MKRGKERAALRLVAAVRRQAESSQSGTREYVVHRVLHRQSRRPTRTLAFYECYRNRGALTAHMKSTSWKALTAAWPAHFEGKPTRISVIWLRRVAGFARHRRTRRSG